MSYLAGIDRIGSAGLAGRKCAFLTNSAALSRDERRAVEAAMDAGVRLVRLLSPEHGLDLQAAEGVPRDCQSPASTMAAAKSPLGFSRALILCLWTFLTWASGISHTRTPFSE